MFGKKNDWTSISIEYFMKPYLKIPNKWNTNNSSNGILEFFQFSSFCELRNKDTGTFKRWWWKGLDIYKNSCHLVIKKYPSRNALMLLHFVWHLNLKKSLILPEIVFVCYLSLFFSIRTSLKLILGAFPCHGSRTCLIR